MSEDDAADKAALELFKNDLQHHETLSSALSGLIQGSLRISFLLNGASIIAVLSLYGAKGTSIPPVPLGLALLAWVVGLGASAIATATYTEAQRQFQIAAWDQVRERAKAHFALLLPGEKGDAATNGSCLRTIAKIAWGLSLAAFGAGAFIIVSRVFFV
jgi:hypothetical protein